MSCRNFINGKAAFSLVELIVVIAIMAVMAAVLAPALLGYVERSRAQKDDSATSEMTAAVQLALADQEIYDEVLEHSVWDNVSCYIDKKDESQFANCKVQLKAANGDKKEQYMFGDGARLLDETVYYAAGNMRGLTITWSPNESGDTYDFANGILNKFVGRKTGLLSENPELYNRLRSVIGDKLNTTSQTYRNSDYTIFIRVGSTGGSEAVMQDAIQVWGQFNGTNLAEKDHKFELSSGRVVGSAGANDATNNQTNNENGNTNFTESYANQLTTAAPIAGVTNATSFIGRNTWTDGLNIYRSDGGLQYILNNGTWEPISWKGLEHPIGSSIWTDGTNVYYSNTSSMQYILRGDTWERKTWNGLTNFSANCVWTDGTDIYYSYQRNQYVLNDNTWEPKTWQGLTPTYGNHVWTDGTNIYYSENGNNYVLNYGTWELKIWNQSTNLHGDSIWTDGSNIYCSNGTTQYIFNNGTWETKTWSGLTSFHGKDVWTDGTNYYYSNATQQYILS